MVLQSKKFCNAKF